MRASVIVRTRDEAYRLRLTLASLARQSTAAEIVVVNDGSRDHTAAVVAASGMGCAYVQHERALGRAAAANAGAKRARGDVLIFLDGDTLASPGLVAAHLAAHARGGCVMARGETLHLRRTRDFLDPEGLTPMPAEAARLQTVPAAELARLRVTMADVRENFAAIEEAAGGGIYPGSAPRKLYALEMDAVRNHPDCGVLWAAASGANFSVNARAFSAAGGFHPDFSINEHRELALRLALAGGRMAAADGARSLHMIHRRGWRDPLLDTVWETDFYRLHPRAEVALLAVFWRGLSDPDMAASGRIGSLPELSAAARRVAHVRGIAAVRRAHFRAAAEAVAA
jgi:glycosyltransferase involved in cell wall biosynthesis